jgi:hypothetical protein
MSARLLAPLAAAVAVVVLGSSIVTASLRSGQPHRSVVALRTAGGVRARHIRESNAQLFDTGYETCSALGLPRLARQYTLPISAEPAARAYAAQFEPAMRAGTYRGCVKALREPAATPP